MKGDFTRNTFDPTQHFTRVLMQQGRVQLDADWNEQVSILLRYLQALAEDLIGPFGGPSESYGFEISGSTISNLKIGSGRYYVDGILCEQDSRDEDGNLEPVPYDEQDNYPLDDEESLEYPFLVYLDVWERHITSIEAPGICEVALGGPDTATRAQVVWQVKIWPRDKLGAALLLRIASDEVTSDNIETWWPELLERLRLEDRGKLAARTDDPDDPEARYRGAENQLYRVEIHRGGDASTATFKWSRDNGSVVAELVDKDGPNLTVSGVRDEARGFAAGQWVELTHDRLELRGEPGIMVRLVKVEGETLTIDESIPDPAWSSDFKNPKVRRWDHLAETEEYEESGGAVPVGVSVQLEDGIAVEFQEGAKYRSGDYWLIPARAATGDVEWPREEDGEGNDQPVALPPHGIEHHYAPLAIVKASDEDPIDLRHKFEPVWKHEIKTPGT